MSLHRVDVFGQRPRLPPLLCLFGQERGSVVFAKRNDGVVANLLPMVMPLGGFLFGLEAALLAVRGPQF